MALKIKPTSLEDVESLIKDLETITTQDLFDLKCSQELQNEMMSYLAELDTHPDWFKDHDQWIKVTNAYRLSVYLVMLKVSELLEKEAS